MDVGSKLGKGAKIATNCFTKDELNFLCELLESKYDLDVNVHIAGKNKGYNLHITSTRMIKFSIIVKPYILPSLQYKLGKY